MNNEDELQGFIEDDKCVSFRWFANVLCIPVEQAKTIMGSYRESHPDVFATYCVTGELKGKNQISIAIVPEEKLEFCKTKYATVNHVHIYSLQKRKFAEMKGQLSSQLSAADTLQANDLLTQSNGQDTLLNHNGGTTQTILTLINSILIKPIICSFYDRYQIIWSSNSARGSSYYHANAR